MIIGDTAHPKTDRKELARTFLRLHGNDIAHRDYYIRLGMEYGLTWEEIGEAVNHG